MKITHLLSEAAGPSIGRKYQHIEDLVLSNGSHGAMHAVERLKHMGEQGGTIELKWDGMPVVYWGRDEKGNFSMIPKNAWAYLKSGKTETASGAPTVMRSPKDVQAFILGTGGGDPTARQAFANQFASLWPYFEKISPKQGFLEGGLLFYPGTKPDGQSAMPVLNKKTGTYDFQPNITTFHIPVDSELGQRIAKSKMMVAATGYYPTMGSSDEQRFPDAEQLSVPGVIVQGTTYVQEPQEVDNQTLANLEAYIKKNAKAIDNYLAPKPGLSSPGGELYSYLNKHLRVEGLTRDFPEWARTNLSAKKAETLTADAKGMVATLGAVEALMKVKEKLIATLSQSTHGGIKQTKPEGYAQAHPGAAFKHDLPGQFVKTISQQTWSPKESVVKEAKGGKKAVIGWGRGMGHTGHDALVSAVIHQAQQTGSTPFFVVSRSFGKDDPIPPETKLAMYKKKFPKYAKMFSLPTADAPTLNDVLAKLGAKGYDNVTLVVGADQKEAFGYLIRPDKSGVPPYKKFGLNSLHVMSRQDTKAPGSDPTQKDYHEGPRATPMREVLLDPSKSEQEQFAVWRQSMSPSLSDEEVLQMMRTAKENLAKFNMPKPKGRKLKEFISRVRPMLKEATNEQKLKVLKLIKEAMVNEFAPGNGDDGLPHAEYVVYQCDPKDQFEFIGGPLYQTDSLGMAHKYAYEHFLRYRPRAFVVYQPHTESSRGNYGVKGESDEEVEEGFSDVVKGIKRKVAGKEDPKEVEHMYGRIARSAIKHKTPDQAERDINRFNKVAKVVNKESAEGSMPYPHGKPEAGDKITWYHSSNYPEIEGTVVGWKDGHLLVQSIDPSPRNTEKTVATYRVPKNNILSVQKQGVAEDKSDAIERTASNLQNPPKVMQHRAKRDMERDEQLKGRDIAKRDDDDFFPGDSESQQLMRYVQQHYPNASTKQQAFIKFAQRALQHSEEEDNTQDKEISQIKQDLAKIKDVVNKFQVSESSDYLDEK